MKLINQKGFSLIEMMITVAVIGILAVVAVPAYRTHIAMSESSRCLNLLTPARAVADSIILSNNGSAASIGTDPTTIGLTANAKQCDGGVTVSGAATGAVTITGKVVTSLGSNTMTLTRAAADGVWQCKSTDGVDAAGYAPDTCT